MREAPVSPFIDALVGVASACRRFDDLIEQASDVDPEILEAVVGLASVRSMIGRVLDAICADEVMTEDVAPAAWRRDLLR